MAATTSPRPPSVKRRQTGYRTCDANIQAKDTATTCGFALNAFYEYYLHHRPAVVQVWSPSTQRFYSTRCGGDPIVICHARDGGEARFPLSAVLGYNDQLASAFARSRDIGPTTSAHQTLTGGNHGTAPVPASVDAVTDDGPVLILDDGSVYSVDAGDQSTVSSWSQGDPAAVEDSGDAATNLSTGERVSLTEVGNTSDLNAYPGTGGDSSIAAKSDDGSIIVLDDSSIWFVSASDQPTSGPWLDLTSIIVNEASDGSYELVNTDDQETVEANYIGQE